MLETVGNRDRALKIAIELSKIAPDEGTRLRAKIIRDRLSLPMTDVLAKVPAGTVMGKCELLGVSRQAYYYWIKGMSRPNAEQAKLLSKITGFDAADIRGRTRLSPPRATPTSRPARRV